MDDFQIGIFGSGEYLGTLLKRPYHRCDTGRMGLRDLPSQKYPDNRPMHANRVHSVLALGEKPGLPDFHANIFRVFLGIYRHLYTRVDRLAWSEVENDLDHHDLGHCSLGGCSYYLGVFRIHYNGNYLDLCSLELYFPFSNDSMSTFYILLFH